MTNKYLLAAVAVIPAIAIAAPAQAQMMRGSKISGQYICVMDKSVSRSAVKDRAFTAARPLGGAVERVFTSRAIKGFTVQIPDAMAKRLEQSDPSIKYCEQDQVIQLIPVREEGRRTRPPRTNAKPGGGAPPPEETPWGIARVGGGGSGSFRTAWVIDTGIDFTHPDLNVDVARSATFVNRTRDANDENGHGTHVAGTIAAKVNGIGVIGVAPGATVVPVRVLDRRGSGTTSGVIAGIDYVSLNGAPGDVANMSLGGGVSTALDQAVVDAAAGGVMFALAAGNESDDANNHSPARAEGPNIYTVSAFSIGDNFASFSNYGTHVDWAEPGVSIKSTWLNGGYNTISGTSMATPHLAGILLATGGRPQINGYVKGDPDGRADPIGVVQPPL